MENIAKAKKIEFNKTDMLNQQVVTIEPCYPGYGITLGNALRRVLLSSLPGAAVVGLRIEGADHEFMTLPHVKEDILEIILNFKNLRLKLHSDEIVKLELDAHGEKEVKASDIKKNSQVDIVNPDLVLAHITDMAGSLKINIYVRQGIGYETIDSREKEKHEIGYIEVDSIYSPVIAVSVNVDNVRVGKMTNWEKLILNITTDGTITTEEAFKQATKILIEQFSALIGKHASKQGEKSQKNNQDENDKMEKNNTDKKEAKDEIKKNDEAEKTKKKRGRPKKS